MERRSLQHTNWSGVPPYAANGDPYWLRGPGIPYLTGLTRPCEIAQGHIDHALAFAYQNTTAGFVYPATRSDGSAAPSAGMPEGTRLQLDPTITEATIRSWGCIAWLTAARAMRVYGKYVADTGGHPKVMFEYEGTAHWSGTVTAETVNPIPPSRLRGIAPPTP